MSEFTPNPGTLPVAVLKPYGKSVAALLDLLAKNDKLQVVEGETAEEVSGFVSKLPGAIVVIHLTEKDQVKPTFLFLKSVSVQVRAQRLRIMLVTPVAESELHARLTKSGVAEVMVEPLSSKALQLKLERHAKLLLNAAPNKGGSGKNKATRTAAESNGPKEPKINWVDPLKLVSDCWLTFDSQAKRYAGKWVFRLVGPSPATGSWEEDAHTRGAWVWKPKDENDAFHKEKGNWVFIGQCPRVQGNYWSFVSKKPELRFALGNDSFGSKVDCDVTGFLLSLAKDSDAGKALLPKIKESWAKFAESKGREGKGEAQAKSYGQKGGKSDQFDEDQQGEDHKTTWGDPIAAKVDLWLYENRKPRWIVNYWANKVLGPAPSSGRWQEVEEGQGFPAGWYWTFNKPEGNPLCLEEGTWVFEGKKQPFFEAEHWMMVGEAPRLGFYKKDSPPLFKIHAETSAELKVSKDPLHAEQIFGWIMATYETRIKSDEEIEKKDSSITEEELESKELSGEFAAEEEREAKDGVFAAEEVGDGPTLTDHEEALPEVKDGVFKKEEDGPDWNNGASPEEKPAQPEGVVLEFKPKLALTGLAVLASELICNNSVELSEKPRRFCRYLSNSCAGMRIEVYRGLECLGTSDGKPSAYSMAVSQARETKGTASGVFVGGRIVVFNSKPGMEAYALVMETSQFNEDAVKYLGIALRVARGILAA